VIVPVGTRAIGILLEGNLHGGESAARGVAIHQELDLGGRRANYFGLMTVDVDGVLRIRKNNGHAASTVNLPGWAAPAVHLLVQIIPV
jgi:hypothetical protein